MTMSLLDMAIVPPAVGSIVMHNGKPLMASGGKKWPPHKPAEEKHPGKLAPTVGGHYVAHGGKRQ
jgi:hypothetical protein